MFQQTSFISRFFFVTSFLRSFYVLLAIRIHMRYVEFLGYVTRFVCTCFQFQYPLAPQYLSTYPLSINRFAVFTPVGCIKPANHINIEFFASDQKRVLCLTTTATSPCLAGNYALSK